MIENYARQLAAKVGDFMTESDLAKISKVIVARLSKLSEGDLIVVTVKYSLIESCEQALQNGNITHGKYSDLKVSLEQMQVGDVINVDPSISSGMRLVANRAKIKIIQQKRCDYIAVQRIS